MTEQEDISDLLAPRCLFCDSTQEVTEVESGADGILFKFEVCREHWDPTMNALVNRFGHAGGGYPPEPTECDHANMVPDVPFTRPGANLTGHGFICADCGFQTLREELSGPSDPMIVDKLTAIFRGWAED